MALTGCANFMKYSLFVFNALILVAGCGLVGFGVYTRTNNLGVTSTLSSILGSTLLPTLSLVLIIAGAIIIVLSFFGCCGAIKEVKCMLLTFFLLLLIMLLGFIAGGIVIYAYRNKIEDITLQQMKISLNSSYGSVDHKQVTEGWDSLQKLFKCCGVRGGINSTESWAYYRFNTGWFMNQTEKQLKYVPESCCRDRVNTPNLNKCQGITDRNLIPYLKPPATPKQENDELFTEGCFTRLQGILVENINILVGVLAGIAFIMVLGMVFSMCLCRRIRSEYDDYCEE